MVQSRSGPAGRKRRACAFVALAASTTAVCLGTTASATSGFDARVVGGEAFLSNGPVEIGARDNGSFGSTNVPPAGYNPRDTEGSGGLGFRIDRDEDGWGTGTDDGDFFLPGAPLEGFSVQVGDGTVPAWNDDSTADLPGAWSAPRTTGSVATATWQSTGDHNGVEVTQVAGLAAGRMALDVTVTLTNASAGALSDVYYERIVDPDNCWETLEVSACDSDGDGVGDANNIYDTLNTIQSQVGAGDPLSVVSATQTDGSYLDLRSDDPNSIVRIDDGEWCTPTPEDLFNPPTGSCVISDTVGTELFTDGPIYLGVHVPALPAGGSHTFTFSYFVSAAAAAPAPDTPLAPTAVAGDAQATVTIAPSTTGSAPTSYTVTAMPGGATCTVTAPGTSCAVTGLTNGTAYTFTSIAHGAGGASDASAASAPVTPAPSTPVPPVRPMSITFPAPADGTSTVDLAATSSSGQAVTYRSLTPAVCTVSGVRVTAVAAGTCTIEATDASDSPAITRSFSVTPPPSVVTDTVTTPNGTTTSTTATSTAAPDAPLSEGALAYTGTTVASALLVTAGVALIGAGTTLLVLVRRRRTVTDRP